MKVKKTLIRISSLLLAAACAVCLLYCCIGFQDAVDAKAYWEKSRDEAENSFALLESGILQFKETQAAYREAVAGHEQGEQELEDGARQLSEGLARLEEYEDGKKQVVEGLEQLLAADTYYSEAGEPLLAGIAERLGTDFRYWTLDAKGRPMFLKGERFLDLDKALQVVSTGRDFLDDTTDSVTAEITARVELLLLTAAVSVLGLFSALLGLFSRRISALAFALLGICAAGAAHAFVRLDGVAYPFCAIAGADRLLLPALPELDFYLALCILSGCLLLQFILTVFLHWEKSAAPASPSAPDQPEPEPAPAPVEDAIEMPPVHSVAPPPHIPEEKTLFEQPESPVPPPAPPADDVDAEAIAKAFTAFLQSDTFREVLNNSVENPKNNT